MSYGIGAKVEVITPLFLGRWICIGEQGIVEGRDYSPAGQAVYKVRLTDGIYTFAPGELVEIEREEK